MIRGALPLLRLEVDRAEALDFLVEVDARGIQLALDLRTCGRVDFLAHLRAFVVGLERLADLLAVVDEVEDEGVFLERVRCGSGATASARPGCPASRLSTYIVCSSGWSKPVWYFSATSSTWYSCVANFSGSSFSRMPWFMPSSV